MSDVSSLSELTRFVGRSHLSVPDPLQRRRAVREITERLAPNRPGRRVSDMLAAVLALSARTRRMVLPRVTVEVDVFSPDGGRAVRIRLPQAS